MSMSSCADGPACALYSRPMYVSSAGKRLSLSSMLLIVRAARSMALSAGGAGSAWAVCAWGSGGGGGCAIEARRPKPGRFGAGVLTNAPGVGRCGVAGGPWKAMLAAT